MSRLPLISLRTFIQATRDSGYKNTSAAIAELVDNAIEANASTIDVRIDHQDDSGEKRITVTDDGIGMDRFTLQLALQFGGSTRFNSRTGTGRYGMGLPNGSLSQARRVEVYSWQNPLRIWTMSLDVDEVAAGIMEELAEPVSHRPSEQDVPTSPTGTVVVLKRCDRLDFKRIPWLVKRLHQDFGRWFRNALFDGKKIHINGEPVIASDPLYLRTRVNGVGAEPYGPPLRYEVELPNADRTTISVRFSLLPIKEWHLLSNRDKNTLGVSKGAGVSVLRAGREIDYGWFFMGTKRRENYDDWWRCEVSFDPEADELFGVTHTKQKISPSENLSVILGEEMEAVARELNGIVRKIYFRVKEEDDVPRSVVAAQKSEVLLPPIGNLAKSRSDHVEAALSRIKYQIEATSTQDMAFYMPSLERDMLKLLLNRDHEFFRRVYEPLLQEKNIPPRVMVQHLQVLLLSAARAECGLRERRDREAALKLRRNWSNALTAFLR